MKKHLLKSLALAAVLLVGGGTAKAQSAGDYLIQNVETGYYLASGGTWGTQAVTHAKPQWLTLAGSDGTFTIETHHGSGHYMTSAGWMDQTGAASVTFASLSDGTYTLSVSDNTYITSGGSDNNTAVTMEGTDGTVNAAKWKLISMSDLTSSMTSATQDSPVDVTGLINNPEMKGNMTDVTGLGTWATTGYDGTGSPSNFTFCNSYGSGSTANVAESYHSTSGFMVTQTLPELTTGVYSFEAQAFYRQDGSDTDNLLTIFFGDQEATISERTGTENNTGAAYTSFIAGTYPTETLYLEVTDDNKSSITIGFKNANTSMWNIFGELTLKYYGANANVTELRYADLMAELETLVTTATTLSNNTSLSTTLISNLNTAISTADAIDSSSDEDDINAAIEALQTAIDAANASIASKASLGTAVNDATNWATTTGGSLQYNYWSTESDVSGVATPFVQTWLSAGNTLTDGTTTYTLSGLDAGTYQVTVTVRIFNENTTDGVTGSLSLSVNGGTAIDAVANGVSAIYNRTSSEEFGTFTVIGNVSSDGVLTFTAANSSTGFNWVAYKDITVSVYSADDIKSELTTLQSSTMGATESSTVSSVLSGSPTDAELVAAVNAARQSVSLYSILADYLPSDIYPEHTGYTRDGESITTATYPTEFSSIETRYSGKTSTDADLVYLQVEGFNAYRTYERQIVSDNITASAYVTNTTFEDSSIEGWEYTTGAANKGVLTEQSTNVDFTNGYLWENWKYSGDGGLNGDMKQTVTNLPSGRYALKMVAFTRDNSLENYGYIKNTSGTESHGVTLAAATPFIVLTDPVEVTDGTVEIGLHVGSGCDWAALGQVELLAVELYDQTRTPSTGASYGTICLPYDFTTTDATIYTAEVYTDQEALTLSEVTETASRGTAYIYGFSEGSESQTFSASYTNNLVAAANEAGAGELQGVLVPTVVADGNYVLQTQEDGQAFYLVSGSSDTEYLTLSAYRAYLTAPATTTAARSIAIGNNSATAIEAVEALDALTSGTAEIYDLSGRKLSKLQKGVNIVNGKKVIVK